MEYLSVKANDEGIANYRIIIPIDNMTNKDEKLYNVEVLDSENNKIDLIRDNEELYFDRTDKYGIYDFTINLINITNIIDTKKIRVKIINNTASNIIEWINKVDASVKGNMYKSGSNSKAIWFSITKEFGRENALQELHRFILNELNPSDHEIVFKVVLLLSYTHEVSNLSILEYLYDTGFPVSKNDYITKQLMKINADEKIGLFLKLLEDVTYHQQKTVIIRAIANLSIDSIKYEEDLLHLLEIEVYYEVQSVLVKVLIRNPSERLRSILENLISRDDYRTKSLCISSLSSLWPSEKTFDLIVDSSLVFEAPKHLNVTAPHMSALYSIDRKLAIKFAKDKIIDNRISTSIKKGIISTLINVNSNEILPEVIKQQKNETDVNLLNLFKKYIDHCNK
ncbi:MAG: hypothetical protein P9L97_02295 [Candidatus Tenebribacter davisii]|nr:hypothetical protein [Candidatus Tenebribacter davisii]